MKSAHSQLQEQHQQLLQQQKGEPQEDEQAGLIAELTEQVQQGKQDLASQRAKILALQQVRLATFGRCHLLPTLFCKIS